MNSHYSAFPVPAQVWGDQYGLTKRELFAAKILQGFCANPAIFARNESSGWGLVNCTDEDLAGYSAHLADAIIIALSKEQP